MRSRRLAFAAGVLLAATLLLDACKTKGTIDISFSAPPDQCKGTKALLYAELNLACPCSCGSCFASKPLGVDGCPGEFCEYPLREVSLDLDPGHWAVVLAVLDDNGTEIASGCTEIQVDADGTGSAAAEATVECETTCAASP